MRHIPAMPTETGAVCHVAPGGNDGASGSERHPWATLQHAADRVGPGDTVCVAAGRYLGFELQAGGTVDRPIAFVADPGAVIDRPNPVTGRDGINLRQVSFVRIEGFTLQGDGQPGTTRAGIRVVGDGTVHAGGFAVGIALCRNIIDHWGKWGILTGYTQDLLIEDNQASRSIREHGIYVGNSSRRVTLRRNHCFSNAGCGIHMNGDRHCGNPNLPDIDGMISAAVVEGNIIHDNCGGSPFSEGGGSGINCDGLRDSVIRNNLLYDNQRSGIAIYRVDGGEISTRNVVVNNTVVNGIRGRYAVKIFDASGSNAVFNNIFLSRNPGTDSGAIEVSADSLPGLVSDFNLLDRRCDLGGQKISAEAWRERTGLDGHSRQLPDEGIEALFSNVTAGDYSLRPGSTARGAGIALLRHGGANYEAPAEDLRQRVRKLESPMDMGAFGRDGPS